MGRPATRARGPRALPGLLLAALWLAATGCSVLAGLVPPDQSPPGGSAQDGSPGFEHNYGLSTFDPHRGLLNVEDFCHGSRRAAVLIDPSDPQRVRGCLRLAPGRRALADLLTRMTPIHVEIDESYDGRHEDPFTQLFMPAPLGELNRVEALQLVEYLQRGGLLLGTFSDPLKHSLQRHAQFVDGIDYREDILGPDHPIFHSYFDLSAEVGHRGVPRQPGMGMGPVGYFMGDQLIAVSGVPGRERGTINTVIYALTRPGSLAHQYVRGVAEEP